MKWCLLGGGKEMIRIRMQYENNASGNVVVYSEKEYFDIYKTHLRLNKYSPIISGNTFENLLESLYRWSGDSPFRLTYGKITREIKRPYRLRIRVGTHPKS